MRKFLILAALAFASLSPIYAQSWIGGEIGFSSDKDETTLGGTDYERTETTFSIAPSYRYQFNDKWAVGFSLGFSINKEKSYTADKETKTTAIVACPYVRYSFCQWDKVSLFTDALASVSFAFCDDDYTPLAVAGFRPGLAYQINDRFTLESSIGFLGYTLLNEEYFTHTSFQFSLDSNISVGLMVRLGK